ncbi:MAG: aspartate ammonia-lyase [Anaerolineales bacterium]|nr:aspartate ammonia-lyase [Anaerolineales bacterium]
MSYRIEHDLLGERQVPNEVYYGVHTLRALENFPVSAVPIGAYPHFVRALAAVKEACAKANLHLGLLEKDAGNAVVQACEEIRGGALREQFVVDSIQGGAGTSANMNVNEVIANRALEILGRQRGDYRVVHPLEHVNMGQSTNDVYPTAIRAALCWMTDDLLDAMEILRLAFAAKAEEFKHVLKVGRTQLQDAVPMTLGQEFGAYAAVVASGQRQLRQDAAELREINLGGTAIGTGINASLDYAEAARTYLSEIVGAEFYAANDLIEATQNTGAFTAYSSALKRAAVQISKIANDLRLLSSGPRAGIGEISLPAVQAGSSIMPGKVNPVIPEVVNQIAFYVLGADVAVSFAVEGGQLELNAFEPLIARSLFDSVTYLKNGCLILAERCVNGITANYAKLEENLHRSVGIVTALNPIIGYEASSSVAKEAYETNRSAAQIVLERGLLTQAQLDKILDPETLTQPRYMDGRQA